MNVKQTLAAAIVAAGAALTAAPVQAQNTPPGPGTPIPPQPPIKNPGGDCTTPGCAGGGTPPTIINQGGQGGNATAIAKSNSVGIGLGGGGGNAPCGKYAGVAVGAGGVGVGVQGGKPDEDCVVVSGPVRDAIHTRDRVLQGWAVGTSAAYSGAAAAGLNQIAAVYGCRHPVARMAEVCQQPGVAAAEFERVSVERRHRGEQKPRRQQRSAAAPRVEAEVVGGACPKPGAKLQCTVLKP